NFPIRMATATSQFILAITSLAAVLQHYSKGSLDISQPFVAYLGMGMIFGAQIGGRFSKKVNPEAILRVLAVTIILVGVRAFYFYFQ
ncbi:MAG: sulfite exporter TauE/SafE family protein, partial [Bdellovibrionales bacterium]|nr:sulfite exporter TauE/SafE family protein [Bdellovibrionales bacterium]